MFPSLLSISSLHRGKLKQGKNERARGKAAECQPRPGKGRHHPLHVSEDDSLEEDDNGRAQSKPQPCCSCISPSPAPGERHRAEPGPAAGRWGAPPALGTEGAKPQCQDFTVAGHDLSRDLTTSREPQSKERTFLLSHSSSRTHSLKVAFSILSLPVKPHKQFILKSDARGTAT